ncbi:MAG: uroporphyrinogen decarboxylase, partial [Flavobacteriales bacterium]|nr:uroporphyrinogen decarboxylase [Flavobacteriales bacterium]
KVVPEEHLSYVLEAIRLTKSELNGRVPLIGFAGAPWTILSYMIEGSGSKTFSAARKFLETEPILAHRLLKLVADSTADYLNAQIDAGADMVQLFDSWAGVLSPKRYSEFGIPYIREICNKIDRVPVTVFAKGAYYALSELGELNCNTIGLDWQMNVEEAKELCSTKTLQGNLDPAVLYADPKTIVAETREMLSKFGVRPHIANLGHGVYPDTNPNHVKVFIETVKEFKHNPL